MISAADGEPTRRPAFPPTVDEATARSRLTRTLRRRPSGWLRPDIVLRIECEWLPFALVSAVPADDARPLRLRCLVDLIEGSVFGLPDDELDIADLELCRALPAEISLDDCVPLARQFLRRRQLVTRTAVDLRIEPPRMCHYPFWVAYWQRRRSRIDVRLLDAVTGRPAGTGLKRAFLAGVKAAGSLARD